MYKAVEKQVAIAEDAKDEVQEVSIDIAFKATDKSYTATATAEVRDDIMDILNLRDPFVLTTGFDRENLYYAVKRPRDKYRELLSYLKEKEEKMPGSSGIIYCLSRKNVEEVCYQ